MAGHGSPVGFSALVEALNMLARRRRREGEGGQ